MRRAQTGSSIDDKKITVKEFLESWLRDVASRLSPKTLERYAQIINLRVMPAIGHVRLSKLQPFEIQALYTKWSTADRLDKKKGGLSARSVLHHHRVLKSALQHAVDLQLVGRNVCKPVKPPKCHRTIMTVLDEDEAAKLLRTSEGTEMHVPVAIALLTGLRRGEILGLRWSDIDWARKRLCVVQSLEQTKDGLRFKTPKTKSGSRTVSVSPLLIDILKKHKTSQTRNRWKFQDDYDPRDLVVAQEDGTPMIPQRVSDRFRPLVARAGVPKVRFHDLRHSHASHALRALVHPKVVSERLGHASVAITMDTYSHVLAGLQEDGAAKVDEAIQAALAKLA